MKAGQGHRFPLDKTSSKWLHRLLAWGLKTWVSPEADYLILWLWMVNLVFLVITGAVDAGMRGVSLSLGKRKW